VAILLAPDRFGVVTDLEQAIRSSGRFHLSPASGIAIHAKPPALEPDPPVTVKERDAWSQQTQAHWLLFGTVDVPAPASSSVSKGTRTATPSLNLALRVFDLSLGDTGPVLQVSGSDPTALAAQTVRFLRAHYPLHASITAISDDAVFLDVGKQDGIDVGSVFIVERHPGPFSVRVGTLRVTSSADWYSTCEVDSTQQGLSPQVGDLALEDTSAYLAN
ncbi:MAG: hypothetical protein KGR26_09565, partial [Cyanobacteria bacterium REEB65]|nr:hypothetical protein [Cyanobacteria bacterium REEB65]